MDRSTRILIVDDSATARRGLSWALTDASSDIVVAGEAASKSEALAAIERLAPDLVTMDVHLGEDDGVELTSHIMATRPLPILVITGVDPRDPHLIFRAMQAGALDVLPKLPGPSDRFYASERKRLVRAIKALATVPVVTRRVRHPSAPPAPPASAPPIGRGQPADGLVRSLDAPQIVVIGASTGGPPTLQSLLRSIPRPFPLPIVVVQHTSEAFVGTLTSWLSTSTGHRVFVAPAISSPGAGDVIVAPGDAHLTFVERGRLATKAGPPRNFHRPSVDVLFESAAKHCGSSALAALLTGMGADGAEGMLALRRAGATTLAQDPTTCTVDSMPRSAIDLGAASSVLKIDEMAARLSALARGAR